MPNELVSIIVGSYNNGSVIHETIESFLNQTYKNIELVLVDDGSTDNTLDVMKKYAEKDNRVKVFHHENTGASGTRELGYLNSTGEYIFLSDADDIWDPDTIQDMYNCITTENDIDVVYTFYRKETDNKLISEYNWKENRSSNTFGEPEVLSGREVAIRMIDRGDIAFPGFVGSFTKRNVFEQLYDRMLEVKDKIPTHYFNDSFCVAQLCGIAKKCILTNKIHMVYRISNSSLSHKQNVNNHVKNYIYAAEEGILLYKKLGWDDVYTAHLLHFYLVILKSWFRVKKYEKDADEVNRYDAEIKRLYFKYYDDLKKFRYAGLKNKVYYYSIKLWKISPGLWTIFIRKICGW